MFLSTALAARARVLISGDKRHLLSMTPYRGIEIITMRHFVDHYQTYL
jgi:predicted nucleic acid-binding protein